MHALVRACRERPRIDSAWNDPAWAGAEPIELTHFRPEGSAHRPRTRARLLHTGDGISGLFQVEDRYVRSVHQRFGEPVCEDSCVEIFLEPRPGRGYLNFEWNAGGTLLASHVTDPRRVGGALAAARPLSERDGRLVLARSSLPSVVAPELATPVSWSLAFFIPLAVLERPLGPLGPLGGQRWRANLYKCGDKTSHPHWASWSPLDSRNFHRPECFGTLEFEPGASASAG
jgi:hypothetical protein